MKDIQKNKVKPFDNLSMESKETNSEKWFWSNTMRKKLESVTLDNIPVQNPSRYIDALGDHLMNMFTEVADIAEDFLNSVTDDFTSYVTGEGQQESKVAPADHPKEKKRTSTVVDVPASFASQEHSIRVVIEKSKLALENVNEEIVEKSKLTLENVNEEVVEKSKLALENVNEEVVEKSTVVLAEQAVKSKVTNSEGMDASISSDIGTVAAVDNTVGAAETSETLCIDDAFGEFEDVQLEDCMEDSYTSCSYKQKLKSSFVSRLQVKWPKKKTSLVTTAQIGSYAKLNETDIIKQKQFKHLPQIKDSTYDSDWEKKWKNSTPELRKQSSRH